MNTASEAPEVVLAGSSAAHAVDAARTASAQAHAPWPANRGSNRRHGETKAGSRSMQGSAGRHERAMRNAAQPL